jgi:hypothetical protein
MERRSGVRTFDVVTGRPLWIMYAASNDDRLSHPHRNVGFTQKLADLLSYASAGAV